MAAGDQPIKSGNNWSQVDWGGLLQLGAGLFAANNTANNNQQAANNYGVQNQFRPYNIALGNSSVAFNGNDAVAALNPTYKGLQNSLASGASGLLGNAQGLFANGGINPYLQGAMNSYDFSAPGNTLGGVNANPEYLNSLGGQYSDAARGFLGGLGNFDPNQAATDYTSNLRNQAQPYNQRATEGLAQQLFNSGRLGSTGGANLLGELANQQNQQDLQFQLAGRNYAGQEQNRLSGLAQGFGAQADQMANTAFNRNLALGTAQFDQGNMRAQQRFQNAMNIFGAGQQNIQNQLQSGLGLLQGAQGLDQGLLQALALGGTLGAQRSGLNQQAFMPGLEGQLAKNNTQGASWLGLLEGLQNSGLGGAVMDQIGGWVDGATDMYGDISPVVVGARRNPSSAGGEAAGGSTQGGSAGSGGTAGGGGGMFGSGSLADGFGGNDLGGIVGGLQSLTTKEGKFAGTASGAAAGWNLGGPWGALVGGIAGYIQEGGLKDMVPWDASGFSGITMDEAFEDQNLARILSNPAAALANRLGLGEHTLLAKVLDPAVAINKDYKEEKTRDEYYKQMLSGQDADDHLFTEGLVGEFRGSRSKYPPRVSGQYGKKDDDKYVADFANKINDAYKSGVINQDDNPFTVYSKVIEPWFNTMGGLGQSHDPQAHLLLTVDMIRRFMQGRPIGWGEARGIAQNNKFDKYLGLNGGKVNTPTPVQQPVK